MSPWHWRDCARTYVCTCMVIIHLLLSEWCNANFMGRQRQTHGWQAFPLCGVNHFAVCLTVKSKHPETQAKLRYKWTFYIMVHVNIS